MSDLLMMAQCENKSLRVALTIPQKEQPLNKKQDL